MKYKLILSCEHASNHIPKDFASHLKVPAKILSSHLAYDLGAREVFEYLRRCSGAYGLSADVSRLLVDCNRSFYGKRPFSDYSNNMEAALKSRALEFFYLPFRQKLERQIKSNFQNGFGTIHISVHSFTPKLRGIVRNAHIGLLYSPKRKMEKNVVNRIFADTRQAKQNWILRKNYPYLGIADGFTSYLRKHFPASSYLGLELEINQSIFKMGVPQGLKKLSPFLNLLSQLNNTKRSNLVLAENVY